MNILLDTHIFLWFLNDNEKTFEEYEINLIN